MWTLSDLDKLIEVLIPTTEVTVVGLAPGIQGLPGSDGVDGDQGVPGADGVPVAVNVLDHGVTGDATTDDTTAAQTLLAGAWPFPTAYYFPTCIGYKVSGTLPVPVSSNVYGAPHQGTRFYPTAGLAVPVFQLDNAGTALRDIAIWNLSNSGLAGVPAIVMGGQQQKLENIDIRSLKGRGVDVTVQNFSVLRNVTCASLVEDAFTVATTYTLLEGCVASGNGGNGFVLKDSPFANGSGILIGCVAENNTGHGYYVIGGDWDLTIYGEANGGDLLHVDGTQQFDTSVTLSHAATAGDTHLTVVSTTKGLPAKSILRFGDGTVAIIDNNYFGTTVPLSAPLTANQLNGAVATLAPEDIHPSRLPTVRLHTGTHDGNIYLNACNYSLDAANFPISGTIIATPSARMVGEGFVKGRANTVKVNAGGGGSRAAGAITGNADNVVGQGLAHTANPTNGFLLTGTPSSIFLVDDDVPGGFYHKVTTQFSYVGTSEDWNMGSVSLGSYSVRALIRDTGMVASNITLGVSGASPATTTFTARTAGWEWISVDIVQDSATRVSGLAGGCFVMKASASAGNIDVACIMIVPKHDHMVLPGTWQNPTRIGISGACMWVDGSGDVRVHTDLPTSDADGTSLT